MEQPWAQRVAIRVSIASIFVNIGLSAFKLFAGITAKSSAMISDAIHSSSDVLSTVIVLIGVRLSGKGDDKCHPYGHERMECVAAIVLSGLLFATGAGIGFSGMRRLITGVYRLALPGTLALYAAVLSIVVKESMYWITRRAARKIRSGALLADAWHHRSDALSSVGSFLGILGARMGFPALDSIACVVICLFILKAAIKIFQDAIDKMTDHSCDEHTLAQIQALVTCQDGVLGIDQLKTRLFGNKIYVDVEIRADGTDTLCHAHDVAQNVHDAIESSFPDVKHCMVHVNPGKLPSCLLK